MSAPKKKHADGATSRNAPPWTRANPGPVDLTVIRRAAAALMTRSGCKRWRSAAELARTLGVPAFMLRSDTNGGSLGALACLVTVNGRRRMYIFDDGHRTFESITYSVLHELGHWAMETFEPEADARSTSECNYEGYANGIAAALLRFGPPEMRRLTEAGILRRERLHRALSMKTPRAAQGQVTP